MVRLVNKSKNMNILNDFDQAASGILFISSLLNTFRIENITVPELIQSGNITAVVLDCVYFVDTNDFTLKWLFDRNEVPVYEWKPFSDPIIRGNLEERLDLSYKASLNPYEERRALRILNPDASLSGEYTCVVGNDKQEVKKTKTMFIYSPPHELKLHVHVWKEDHHYHEVACIAHGVYPQPNLLLQRDHVPVERQKQQVWRNGDGVLLDAKSSAIYRNHELRDTERFNCRLEIPGAGYTTMNERLIVFRNSTHDSLIVKHTTVDTESNKSNDATGFTTINTKTIVLCAYLLYSIIQSFLY